MAFVRMAKIEDLPQLEAFDEWGEATRDRIERGECAVVGEESPVLAYAIFDSSFFKEKFVAYIYVHPDHRGEGLGSRLMEFIESAVKDGTLYISTGLKNLAMQAVLKKREYRITGMIDFEGYPEMVFVKNLDAPAGKQTEAT